MDAYWHNYSYKEWVPHPPPPHPPTPNLSLYVITIIYAIISLVAINQREMKAEILLAIKTEFMCYR